LGHIAFQVESAGMVDQFVDEFLNPRDIAPLYGGAKAYPEYAEGYYAVYFEDPDRIKIEVVHEPGAAQSS
jgi:catechol 2,3-dioxygenase-like lactoylglutathione lyase family enzyme